MRRWSELLANPAALRDYLDALDAKFAKPDERVEIPARVMHAWGAVQEDFKVAFSTGSEWFKVIDAYFERKYGQRNLVDLAIGRMLVRIGHEAWVVRFPLCYGRVRLDLARMIENAPRGIVGQLTKPERAQLEGLIPRAFAAFDALKRIDPVMRVDWSNAVDQAVDPRGNFGLSKWSSQQVVEKMLSAFVRAHGGTMPSKLQHPHDLAPIFKAAEAVGLRPADQELVNAVQCRATIRYPSNKVKLQEAIIANQASVFLCGDLACQWRGLQPAHVTLEVNVT